MFSDIKGIELLIFFLSVIFSMGIHEAMHAFTSHWLGDSTAKDEGRLTLNPLKHIDFMTTVALPVVLLMLGLRPFFIAKPVPFNPDSVKYDEFGAALIGLAGPFTNLALAAIAGLIANISGVAVGTTAFMVFSTFVAVNVGFFVFNMIPFPPLDGSRLLYALAPEPVQRVMYQIETGGLFSIIIFMFVLFPLLGEPVYNVMNTLYHFFL